MRPFISRQVIPVVVAFAVVAGSLLAAEPASAQGKALFRVERKFLGAPFPAKTYTTSLGKVKTYGGAGVYEVYIEPYTTRTLMGGYVYPPGNATVEAGNPVGGAFTLQSKFIDFQGTYTNYADTAFPGYTTVSVLDYYNAIARFGPNKGAAGPTRVVFPTTLGNPTPNYGSGNAVTPTTTFGGDFEVDRAGSMNITPGSNRFGGTMRFLYRPTATFYQYIFKFDPAIYKAYGSFRCQRAGIDCTIDPSGPFGPTDIGEITSSGMVFRYLLNDCVGKNPDIVCTGTNTTMQLADGSAKATVPTTPNGAYPNTNYEFVFAGNYYLHLLHPWTTGLVSGYNYFSTYQINPYEEGYDKSLGGTDITVTNTYTYVTFNETNSTLMYRPVTFKQYLSNVQRVVSLVRPRITHSYQRPIQQTDPIIVSFQAPRVWTMKVFFLPESTGVAMLGAGIVALLGLSRIRRR